jgi:hypothetical protein
MRTSTSTGNELYLKSWSEGLRAVRVAVLASMSSALQRNAHVIAIPLSVFCPLRVAVLP